MNKMDESVFDTAMMATPLGDKISEVLMEVTRCPICLDTLLNPRTLKCGHTFCTTCLNILESKERKQNDIIRCPLCRCDQIITAGIERLPTDKTITKLLHTFQTFESAIVTYAEIEQMMVDIIFCIKCNNMLENPKRLLCGHILCSKCLDNIKEKAQVSNDNPLFQCPKCDCDHIIFPGVDYFKTDTVMSTLLETIANTDLCEQYKQEMDARKQSKSCAQMVKVTRSSPF